MGNASCCSSNDGRPEFETLTAAARGVVGQKKALLVGLNYRNTRAELHGCINDVNNMQTVLVQQYGFKLEDIMMLNEDQDKSKWPYKKVIMEGLQWLYQGAKDGDLLFFHYSGHGSTYQLDKKAMAADAICPLDCLDKQWPEAVILDTEIHEKLYDPLPKGCKAVCIFDCCHSATVANLCETMVVKEGPMTAARKAELVKELTDQKNKAAAKVRFYNEINSGKLDIKKKTREEMIKLMEAHQFPKRGPYYDDDEANYNYLIGLSISHLFKSSVEKDEAILERKTKALAHVESLKPGEGAQIYVGNLEEEQQTAYTKSHSSTNREIRLRYLPQPKMDQDEDAGTTKPLGTGLRDVLRKAKYEDHQLWVFSGCQDDQTSADAHVDGIYQGAFTWALIKALKSDGYMESYSNLLLQIKSNLEGGSYKQVPALSTTRKTYLDYGFCGKLREGVTGTER
ncbi:pca1 [Symbiodinium pilosum]|uniref:Pca1 protein n=1 Tax=Symbiodinium pilosum TaxID=2952 RepID=A0A812WGJ3_SYMPI|nr:pca1 [Symbiodinium pilosum]